MSGERALATPVRVAAPIMATLAAVAIAVVGALLVGLGPVGLLVVVAAVVAVATVVAHRTVASMFAGLTLVVIRPYAPGERVRIQSPVDGRLIDAAIVHIGAANTTLASDTGIFVVPNNRLLRNPPSAAAPERCPEPCP